jgi:hypothetical protein
MVTEGESMTRSPGRLTRVSDREKGNSTMKGLDIVSLVFGSGAGRSVLRAFDGVVTFRAENESAGWVGGDGETDLAADVELAGLGADVCADKCVEPTIAELSRGALVAISAREFAVGGG